MKGTAFFLLILSAFTTFAHADVRTIQTLYTNTFGDPANDALIFVHGGPGYNSYDFEETTALKLSQMGYYVVVYDERGQGRSGAATDPSDYTYKRYADDIKILIDQLHLQNPTLLGHSHGGPICLKFDQFYPRIAKKIVLIDAPVRFQSVLDAAAENCQKRYLSVGDQINADKIMSLGKELTQVTDDRSVEAKDNGLFFQMAANCGGPNGLYAAKNISSTAPFLYQEAAQSFTVPQENIIYPAGYFVLNEDYIHLDNTEWVKANAAHIYGIYGDQDGLFDSRALNEIKKDLTLNPSSNSFQMIINASHNVFIDQQELFLAALSKILKP